MISRKILISFLNQKSRKGPQANKSTYNSVPDDDDVCANHSSLAVQERTKSSHILSPPGYVYRETSPCHIPKPKYCTQKQPIPLSFLLHNILIQTQMKPP